MQLAYVTSSDDDVTFRLTNESAEPVAVRGSRLLWLAIDVWPGDTGFECEPKPGAPTYEEPLGIADGNPGMHHIEPGEHVRLDIHTQFPQKYAGNRCRVLQRLQDGTVIGPFDFRP